MRTIQENVKSATDPFRRQWSRFVRSRGSGPERFQFSRLPWLGAPDLDRFVESLHYDCTQSMRSGAPPPVDLKLLLEQAIRFHEKADTFTLTVEDAIRRYAEGRGSVRVAHQPNFLPSINVIGQAAVLSELAGRIPGAPPQLCFVIDYDVNTDRRYRNAILPSMCARKGYHSFSVPRVHRRDERFIYAESRPGDEFYRHLVRLLHSYTAQDLAIVRQLCGYASPESHELRARETSIANFLEVAFCRGSSLAESNTIFWSSVVNRFLGLPTIFVQGRNALSLVPEHIEYLWERSSRLDRVCEKTAADLEAIGLVVGKGLVMGPDVAPFWISCPRDNSRVTMLWNDRGHRKASGVCAHCSSKVVVTERSVGSMIRDEASPAVIPRVVWDDLLDGFAWGHIAGCSYPGGIEHYIFTACVAVRMGLSPLPEYFSQSSQVLQPESDFEYAAKRAEQLGGYISAATGSRSALRLQSSGRGTFVHTMLWRQAIDAHDLAAAFSGEVR